MIDQNALILTVNSRLARQLQQQYHHYAHSHQKKIWTTPSILPMSRWLKQIFQQNNSEGLFLLSDFQEQCAWEQFTQHSFQTTEMIRRAWQLLIQWEVPLETLIPFHAQLEARYLTHCINEFQTKCKQNRWITESEIPAYLLKMDHQVSMNIPEKMILTGFDDISPNIQSLLDQWKTRSTIQSLELKENTPHVFKALLPDRDTELQAMATWAKEWLKKNPQHRIACIVPDLAQQRTRIQRAFSTCMDQVNISAGVSLYQHDMIKTALLLLHWVHQSIPIEDCQYLLQSPYLCTNEAEANAGAQLDAILRRQHQHTVQLADLLNHPDHARTWISRCSGVILYKQNQKQTASPSQFAQQFAELLRLFKWPGQHTQDSDHFQRLERFKKCLFTFSQCDWVLSFISYSRALSLFNMLMQQTIFQPKSHHEPIQIIGTLESSGLTFDAAWVMGLHQEAWPPPAKPNPFIPYPIQQQFQMPHATAGRELHFCKQITERLKQCAPTVIFSAPLQIDDEITRPSALINHLPEINVLELLDNNKKNKLSNTPLEILSHDPAPMIDNLAQIRGGSRILTLQAICPFQAFAAIRLQAAPLETPQLGVNSADRGVAIHRMLDLFWGDIKNQRTLNTLSDVDIEKKVSELIDRVITEDSYFWSVEKKRLLPLIIDWLALEKQRSDFEVIQREKTLQITLSELPLTVRIDRVDRLQDGSLLLMDYKTGGNHTIQHWFQERLTEPQLPLYAAFHPDDVEGICFANIQLGELAFKGVINENRSYANIIESKWMPVHWNQLQTQWKNTLTALAYSFYQGDARIDPSKPSDCQFCSLYPLCRIKHEVNYEDQ